MKIEKKVSDKLIESKDIYSEDVYSEVDYFVSSFLSREREIGHLEEIKKNLPILAKRFSKAKKDFIIAKNFLDYVESIIAKAHDIVEVYEIDNFKYNKYVPEELHALVFKIQNLCEPEKSEKEVDI